MKINGNPDGGGGKSAVIESLSVTSNGTYTAGGGVDGYSPVEVSVPERIPVTESLSVSVNNTYYPGQGVDGFSQVIVDVPQSVTGYTEKEITEGIQIVNLYNGASSVHPYVFEKDTYLQTVNLPNCTVVNEYAFANCTNLTSVSLSTCSYISVAAFSGCINLLNVYCPELTSVNQDVFAYCEKLQSVDFPNLTLVASSMFKHCSSLSQVSLPECTSIMQEGFVENYSLTSIYIPKCSVVDRNAFNNCHLLMDIDLTKFTSIGQGAFAACYSLSQALLTNCFSMNLYNMFNGCSNLELLSFGDFYLRYSYNNTLPNTKLASGIGSIYVPDYNYDWYISANGWSSLSARFVSYETAGAPLLFSDGLVYGSTTFLDYNFNSALGISYMAVTDINLPECTDILPQAGYSDRFVFNTQCKNLKTISLPISYGYKTLFENLSSLQFLNLPGCTYISENMCQGCRSLTSVSLPECSFIGQGAFLNCYSLSEIVLPKCEYISKSAFNNCSGLISVNLPVCSYLNDFAFYGGYNITNVSLPLCEYIGWNTFYGCSNISSIDLPVCSYLSNQAFFNCSSLTQIYLRSNSVCGLYGTGVFQGTPMSTYGARNGSIFVPASLVDAYKSAPNWSQYSSHIFPITE